MTIIDIVYHAESKQMELVGHSADKPIGTDGDDYATYLRFSLDDGDGRLDGFGIRVEFDVLIRGESYDDEPYKPLFFLDDTMMIPLTKKVLTNVRYGAIPIQMAFTGIDSFGKPTEFYSLNKLVLKLSDSIQAIEDMEIQDHVDILSAINNVEYNSKTATFSFRQIDGRTIAVQLSDLSEEHFEVPTKDDLKKLNKAQNGDTATTLDDGKWYKLYGIYSDPQSWKVMSPSVKAVDDHISDRDNPHNVTKSQLGLGNVDNTSDIDKPISSLTQEALDTKADAQELSELSKIVSKEIADRESSDDSISQSISTHISDTSNPHSVTKSQIGLSNVDNTSDINKPISTATQNALNDKASKSDVDVVNDALTTHKTDTSNPHGVNKSQLGLENVDNTSDINKPISTATQNALNDKASKVDLESTTDVLNEHVANLLNPHNVTKTQLGLENVDNTSDINKPISTATQNALDGKASTSDLESATKKIDDHIKDTDNPHNVTKTQLGLENVDNTSDINKPISTATQNALDGKADKSELTPLNTAIANEIANREQGDKTLNQTISDHTANTSNPHNVTKTQLGLGNVDNTSDMDKPISTAVQKALDDKASKSDLSKIYRPCGSVNTFDELPTNPQIGDVYDVASNGMNYAWVEIDGVPQWDELGSIGDNVDMSNYYTKEEVDTKVSNYLPLDGGTLSGTLSIIGTTTFGSNVFMDGTGTPLIIGNKGKIGLRAKGNSIGNAGQINISDSWYGGNQTQWGAQISAYDGVENKYNQLRVSHEGLQYLVYDNATGSESAKQVALVDDIPDISGLATKGEIPSIDSSLSSTSTNPVQNKTIQSELSKKQNNLVAGSNISIATDGVTISAIDTTYGVASTTANGLMSKDDKSKLDGISAGAQVNSITGVKGNAESTYRTGNVNITPANIGLGNVNNTSDANKPISTATQNALDGKQATLKAGSNISIATDGVTISAIDTTYSVVTDSANGLMSSAMLEKLNGISAGANKTTVDSSLNDTSTNPVQNKVINTALAGKSDSSHTHSEYLPLTGGTVSNKIIISGSNPHLGLRDTSGSEAYLQTYNDGSGLKVGFGYGWTNSLKLDGSGNIYGSASIYQNGKQVANKEDIPNVSGLATKTELSSGLNSKQDNITISDSLPSGGNDGDVWIVYGQESGGGSSGGSGGGGGFTIVPLTVTYFEDYGMFAVSGVQTNDLVQIQIVADGGSLIISLPLTALTDEVFSSDSSVIPMHVLSMGGVENKIAVYFTDGGFMIGDSVSGETYRPTSWSVAYALAIRFG